MAYSTGEIRKILQSGDKLKIDMIPYEDLVTFYENEAQRKEFSMSGVKNLYAAVCADAVSDYKTLHKLTMFGGRNGRPIPKSMEERDLEEFFGSEFFLAVTKLRSKENAIKVLENTILEEKKRRVRRAMA